MEDKFVVRPKKADKKEDKSIVMTLRMDKELQEEFVNGQGTSLCAGRFVMRWNI